MAGIEPATSSLPRKCSTAELHRQKKRTTEHPGCYRVKLFRPVQHCAVLFRAEDGTQTRDPQLGRLMLYQLSYFRSEIFRMSIKTKSTLNILWAVMDSNHRRRSQLSYSQPHLSTLVTAQTLSLLSDSNQRPRDYKSRALAN